MRIPRRSRTSTRRLTAPPDGSAFLARALGQAGAAALSGGGLGVLLLWTDARAQLTLPVPLVGARTLLSGLVTAIVTVAVFSLWMRSVVAGMAASQVSPRIVTGYLDDRFQWHLLVGMSAAFTFTVTVLLGLPSGDEQPVPALSTCLAVAAVVAGLVMVLVALRNAVHQMALPRIVRSLADQALEALANDPAPDDPWPEGYLSAQDTRVRARHMGWVQSIDHRGILERLPPGAQLVLHVDAGSFVGPGDILASCDTRLDPQIVDRVRRSVSVDPVRAPYADLTFALQQLRDMAQQAMRSGSTDTSTSHEALLYLGVVLGSLLERGALSGHALGADGRAVTSFGRWTVRDHLQEVLEPLVGASGGDPVARRHLHVMLDDLKEQAGRQGDVRSQELLQEQLDLLGRSDDREPVRPMVYRPGRIVEDPLGRHGPADRDAQAGGDERSAPGQGGGPF